MDAWVVIIADWYNETSVKRGVPVRGQQQPVVDIQSLVITAAVRPCNDVTGAQQRFTQTCVARSPRW